jgi:hypothetical protein
MSPYNLALQGNIRLLIGGLIISADYDTGLRPFQKIFKFSDAKVRKFIG